MKATHLIPLVTLLSACAAGPGGEGATDIGGAGDTASDLSHRAYVVSAESNELFVFDFETLEAIGSVDTSLFGEANANHMAIVSPDGAKVFISASHARSLVVVDAASLEVTGTIDVGTYNSHMSVRPGTSELWVVNEDDDSVSVVDMDSEQVLRTITDDSFDVPHFVRFSGDFAYIANIGGNQISVLDLSTDTVVDTLVADGTEEGACAGDPCGFADAQISPDGILFASHIETGTVLVYDTVNRTRLADVPVGTQPWSAFVDPFGGDDDAAMVPSWGDLSVSRIGADGSRIAAEVGDSEVYGVNYSPTAPGEAFVLNRSSHEVIVVDRATGARIESLDVGGTTETATTTPDGRLLLPVSSAGAVAVIDTATHEEIARFEDVGVVPWSVATAAGQNYCH